MPRKARKTSQSGIYHVMLRGVNRQRIFETESDYLQMQEILAGLHVKCDDTGHVITDKCCKIFAYCLMGNHLHLLIKEVDITIGDIIKSLASRYVFYFNRCHCRVGHLFQERFKSEPVESPEYFIALLRYIHLNPVKAGIVRKADDYRWSSWHEFLNPTANNICDVGFALSAVTLDELRAMMEYAASSEYVFLDVDEDEISARTMLPDSLVRERLLAAAGCGSMAEFHNLPFNERKAACLRIRELGAGVRQLARMTGLCLATISGK